MKNKLPKVCAPGEMTFLLFFMNIIGNRKLTGTIKGNLPEFAVLPQTNCSKYHRLYCTKDFFFGALFPRFSALAMCIE